MRELQTLSSDFARVRVLHLGTRLFQALRLNYVIKARYNDVLRLSCLFLEGALGDGPKQRLRSRLALKVES